MTFTKIENLSVFCCKRFVASNPILVLYMFSFKVLNKLPNVKRTYCLFRPSHDKTADQLTLSQIYYSEMHLFIGYDIARCVMWYVKPDRQYP